MRDLAETGGGLWRGSFLGVPVSPLSLPCKKSIKNLVIITVFALSTVAYNGEFSKYLLNENRKTEALEGGAHSANDLYTSEGVCLRR